MYSAQKNRSLIFDITKSLGIIFMVCGHSGAPFIRFVYLFHMALFFMVAGYFFSNKSFDKFCELIKYIYKKIKRLWLPLVVTIIILTLMHNFFIKINFYTNNILFLEGKYGNKWGIIDYYTITDIPKYLIKTLYFQHGEQLAGAAWFVIVMFYILCSSAILRFTGNLLIKNKKIFLIFEGLIYFLLFITGYILSLKNYNQYLIGSYCTGMFLFYLGILYNKYESRIKLNWQCFIINYIILLCLNKFTTFTELAANQYYNPFTLIAASVSGFLFTMCIAKLLTQRAVGGGGAIVYLGQNTMSVLLLHFIAFKLITFIELFYYHLPIYYLASFPIYKGKGLWWIFYTLSGIVLPLSAKYLWDKFKTFIRKNHKLSGS